MENISSKESELVIKLEDIFDGGVVGYYNFREVEQKIASKIIDYLTIHKDGIEGVMTSEKVFEILDRILDFEYETGAFAQASYSKWHGINIYINSEKGNELRMVYKQIYERKLKILEMNGEPNNAVRKIVIEQKLFDKV